MASHVSPSRIAADSGSCFMMGPSPPGFITNISYARCYTPRWRLSWCRPSSAPSHPTGGPLESVTDQWPSTPSVSPGDVPGALDLIYQNSCALRHGSSICISGRGFQLGMDSIWSLSVRPDGAFREEISCPPHLSSTAGYDGSEGSSVWDVDSSGVSQTLEFDDHEFSLLSTWIRSGAWALPRIRHRLSIHQHYDNNTSQEIGTSPPPPSSPLANIYQYRITLKNGRLEAIVSVDTASWQPTGMVMCLSGGDTEEWKFHEWTVWNREELPHPSRMLQDSMSGGRQELNVYSIHVVEKDGGVVTMAASAAVLQQYIYTKPEDALLPSDSTYIEGISPAVPAWYTSSGHLIVLANINGAKEGDNYFILDTGASGFVIEPAAADELNLPTFGELHITGVSGRCKGKFRKGDTFQIGPLILRDPVLMEMSCAGLVTGAPGPVVGIIGYDVFRRAVVDIPPKPSPKVSLHSPGEEEIMSPAAAFAFTISKKRKNNDSSAAQQSYVHLYHPEDETAAAAAVIDPTDWAPVVMLSSLPHVHATLHTGGGYSETDNDNDERSDESNICLGNRKSCVQALMMVDTGAGGMEAMLNAVGAVAAGLLVGKEERRGGHSRSIRGVGGSATNSITLESATMEALRVGGVTFESVKCLVAGQGVGGGVELSHYSSGMLCGALLTQCRVVIDLPRKRIGFVRS